MDCIILRMRKERFPRRVFFHRFSDLEVLNSFYWIKWKQSNRNVGLSSLIGGDLFMISRPQKVFSHFEVPLKTLEILKFRQADINFEWHLNSDAFGICLSWSIARIVFVKGLRRSC